MGSKTQKEKTKMVEVISTMNVGPNIYSVEAGDLSRLDRIGECDSVNSKITIQEGLPPLRLREVLFHEMLHAIMFEYGISLGLEPKQEESLVQILIPALLCTFEANPGLAAMFICPMAEIFEKFGGQII